MSGRVSWVGGGLGPLLCAIGQPDEPEPTGMDSEAYEAWRKAHPMPSLAIIISGGVVSDGFDAIAFDGWNGWRNAIINGERKVITPGRDDERKRVSLPQAMNIAETFAGEWIALHMRGAPR